MEEQYGDRACHHQERSIRGPWNPSLVVQSAVQVSLEGFGLILDFNTDPLCLVQFSHLFSYWIRIIERPYGQLV